MGKGQPGTPGAVVQMTCETTLCTNKASLYLDNGHGGHRFVCGSCHYRESHPAADPRSLAPNKTPRPLSKQKERLF